LQSGLSGKAQATIESSAEFYRSSLADRCLVRGKIYDSVLFPGVEVGKNSEIRGCVILPDVRIGDNVKLARTMIDVPNELPQNVKVQIADGVKIGNVKSRADNKDHPEALVDGFTYIGAGTLIPRGVTIGGGCYLAAATPKSFFSRNKNVAEGRSIEK
jgi:glucose-1-phosphate adenylyltransferase